MKCQKCGKNEANTHITKIVNGEKRETYLCESCAAASGEIGGFKMGWDSDFDSIFSSFFALPRHMSAERKQGRVCPKCKSTISEIASRGKIGCAECYSTFRDYLLKPIKQIHASAEHTGKLPKRAGKGLRAAAEIEKLKAELNAAVLSQNYEQAAVLRDKINMLKNENNGQEA